MDYSNWTSAAEDVPGLSSWPYSSHNSTPANYSDSADTEPFNGSSTMVTAVIYITVFVVGLMGNTLSIFVVARYAKMKTVTNMYILNLALADELYILGIPFLGTQTVLSYWPYGEFLCKVYMTADAMSQFTSTFCLTAMSFDRYLAVVHPIRSGKWRSSNVSKVVNTLVWVVSFLVVLPVSIYSDVQDRFNSCNMSWPSPQHVWSTAFILYTSILGFFGPLVIICICYILIVIKVRSAGMRVGRTKRRKSERKVTRMVVVIVLVFVLCWLPFFVANIVNLVYTIPENDVAVTVYSFLVILTYVNSCANPILYGFLSDNFKQSFKKVLCLPRTIYNGCRRRWRAVVAARAEKAARAARAATASQEQQQPAAAVAAEAADTEEKLDCIQNGKTQQSDVIVELRSANSDTITAVTDVSVV